MFNKFMLIVIIALAGYLFIVRPSLKPTTSKSWICSKIFRQFKKVSSALACSILANAATGGRHGNVIKRITWSALQAYSVKV